MTHVIVVVMENHSYNEVRGLPYLSGLIARSSSFSQSFAVTHPSEPNYIALWAASTLGVTNDDCPAPGSPFTAENLGHACEAAGLTWKAYCENLPAPGSPDCSSTDGLYRRKHAPWPNFSNLNHLNEVPYTQLAADIVHGALPVLAFVIPNMCDDMHDCSTTVGDTWLSNNLPAMSSGVGPKGLAILSCDQDDKSSLNNILTVFAGPLVKVGYVSSRTITHYTVVRTICDALGLRAFGLAASESAVSDVWKAGTVAVSSEGPARVSLSAPSPDPFGIATTATLWLPSDRAIRVSVFDCSGRQVGRLFAGQDSGAVEIRWDGTQDDGRNAKAGLYFLGVEAGGTLLVRKLALTR